MRLLSIASGSSGNCIYVGNDTTHILVDAGISNKRIEQGLNEAELTGSDINGLCITHEHSDHIQAVGVLARKHGIPIYATEKTIQYIKGCVTLGNIDQSLFHAIDGDTPFTIGNITVDPFHIYHDAADPVAYTFKDDIHKVGIATDMGHYDDYIVDHLQDLEAMVIESNHDIRMLETGPYPYILKRRILGERGHLSNENCGRLLCRILNDSINKVFLGHLSKENNYPELALEAVKCEILENSTKYRPDDIDISVASRDFPSKIVKL